MRRLGIIDLAGGHQPIADESDSLRIVFNGEIYNYRELPQPLIDRCHMLRTNSDTEPFSTCTRRWDRRAWTNSTACSRFTTSAGGSVFVARDRFGIKPLCVVAEPTIGPPSRAALDRPPRHLRSVLPLRRSVPPVDSPCMFRPSAVDRRVTYDRSDSSFLSFDQSRLALSKQQTRKLHGNQCVRPWLRWDRLHGLLRI